MKMLEKNKIEHSLVENDDYFYRDQEMYRAEVENPIHEEDSTFKNKKRETTLKKWFLFFTFYFNKTYN